MKNHLDIYDYLAVIVIFGISILIGVYHGFKQRIRNFFSGNSENSNSNESSVNNYLQANSSMGYLPITFSLLASFFSATALLGIKKLNLKLIHIT
jgi:hypothetical protein